MHEVEFLKYILENIVANPAAIEIERTEDEMGTLLSVRVDREDMKNVIGKGGANINAIRTIMRMYSYKNQKRVNLKVLD